MMASYSKKKFGIRKAEREFDNAFEAVAMGVRGGWFGLTHENVGTHFSLFSKLMQADSPFVVFERAADTYALAAKAGLRINDRRVRVIHGEIFPSIFEAYPKVGWTTVNRKQIFRKPMFAYAHLDFCCTAAVLTDEGIEMYLRRIAKWWAIKDHFVLDITVARRGDKGDKSAKILLEKFIPNAFAQLNWGMKEWSIRNYKDTSAMTNGFFRFQRNNPTTNRKVVHDGQSQFDQW